MRSRVLAILQLAAFLMLSRASYGGPGGTFTVAGSTLLFRDESLRLAIGQQKVRVPNPPGTIVEGSVPIPSLASSGERIAVELLLTDNHPKAECKLSFAICPGQDEKAVKSVVGVYSLNDKSWKLFGDFCPDYVSSMTLSQDGTKVAFISKSKGSSQHCFDNPAVLQILDIETGEFTAVPYRAESLMNDSPLGWSPDGRYLVGQLGSMETPTQQIVLIEIASGIGKIIARGTAPSWSPKGDWIAFIAGEAGGEKCMLIRPDGTDVRMVHALVADSGNYAILYRGAVWSPDGGKLLFNEMKADEPTVRVTMVTLSTGKVITQSHDGLIVFGWGRESNHR